MPARDIFLPFYDIKSCYQLIKTITKFEKEAGHHLYVFIKNNLQLTRRMRVNNART